MKKLNLSPSADRAAEQSISYLIQAAFQFPDCISLAAGFVDETTLPTQLVLDAAHRVLTPDARGRSPAMDG